LTLTFSRGVVPSGPVDVARDLHAERHLASIPVASAGTYRYTACRRSPVGREAVAPPAAVDVVLEFVVNQTI